jgi:hypothetical protein
MAIGDFSLKKNLFFRKADIFRGFSFNKALIYKNQTFLGHFPLKKCNVVQLNLIFSRTK